MMRVPNRLRDDRGFALALAIFALVLLAAVVAGGYFSASQEFQIGRGMRSLTTSVYSGEAGIQKALQSWNSSVMRTLAPGDTITYGPVDLEGGGAFLTHIVRVGRDADSLKRYFYIEAVGQTPLPTLGARRQAMVVRARFPELCCSSALKVAEELDLVGGGQEKIVGFNTKPFQWSDALCAGLPSADGPGLIISNPGEITGDITRITGSPPVVVEPVPENQISFTGYSWNDLVALADVVYTGYESFTGSTKSVINGECNRDDRYNLGAPQLPGHACFDYFPIVYVADTLKLTGGGVAQGIFLVEDKLLLNGPFDVYGIVLARDDLQMTSQSIIYGMTWSGDDVDLDANSQIYLSRCGPR
jgi:hypothetical protein